MADQQAEDALQVTSAECIPVGEDRITVRLGGVWHGRENNPSGSAMLIVESRGRHHRFPAVPQSRRSALGRAGEWTAEFTVPAWLSPSLDENATLALGEAVLPVALPAPFAEPNASNGHRPASEERSQPPSPHDPLPASDTEPAPARDPLPADGPEPPPADEPARAEIFNAELDRLRVELRERASTEARLRGELADLRSQLRAHADAEARFETAREAVRVELEQVRALMGVEDERRAEVESRAMVLAAELAEAQQHAKDLEAERDAVGGELATAQGELEALRIETQELRAAVQARSAAHEAALAEATGLRAELERLGEELTAARVQLGAGDDGVAEAEALLAEARALSATLRER